MKQNIKKEKLSQKKLKKLLHYDEATGIFTWKERPVNMFLPGKYQASRCKTWNTKYANSKAGTIWTPPKVKTSYLRIGISLNGKTKLYKAHRLAILYTDGHFPPEVIDHIDGNGLNNRRDNSREVTHQENLKNQSIRSTNTSGTVGVYWFKRDQKWQISICVNGKQIHGGYFINKADEIEKENKWK